jgi:hypothetical protein
VTLTKCIYLRCNVEESAVVAKTGKELKNKVRRSRRKWK